MYHSLQQEGSTQKFSLQIIGETGLIKSLKLLVVSLKCIIFADKL